MAKIVIFSPNAIGKSMAGAAIRPWEFAYQLAKHHEVVLLAPAIKERLEAPFEVVDYRETGLKNYVKQADVLIAQRLTFPLAVLAKRYGVKIIIDAYAPGPLELLEHFKEKGRPLRDQKVQSEISTLVFSFKMADAILCAHHKQKDLWLGFLLALKKIPFDLYDREGDFHSFLLTVPFGLSLQPLKKRGEGFRKKWGIAPSDKVLVWGGGIWNWFDPLSLIVAMQSIASIRSDIKLVFMGVIPPDPQLPLTKRAQEAKQLAHSLGVMNKSVFFHEAWVAYEERLDFLLEADVGVSTHFAHLETEFSFRTRMLDYLMAGLPIIASKGDYFAELIEREQLGITVPPQDSEKLAAAILQLFEKEETLGLYKKNIERIRPLFDWSKAVAPLVEKVEILAKQPKKSLLFHEIGTLFCFLCCKIKERGGLSLIKQYLLKRAV